MSIINNFFNLFDSLSYDDKESVFNCISSYYKEQNENEKFELVKTIEEIMFPNSVIAYELNEDETQYNLHIAVFQEEDEGDYSAIAINLPGVVERGDTEEEAIKNIKNAAKAVIKCYHEDKIDIPWICSKKNIPKRHIEQWIKINIE